MKAKKKGSIGEWFKKHKLFSIIFLLAVAIALPVTVVSSQYTTQVNQFASCLGKRLQETAPLQFDKTTIGVGDTITGTATYTNTAPCDIYVQDMVIEARPQGASRPDQQGQYARYTFLPHLYNTTLHQGDSITIKSSLTIQQSMQTGEMYAFVAYQTANQYWHYWDGSAVPFSITASGGGGLQCNPPCPAGTTCTQNSGGFSVCSQNNGQGGGGSGGGSVNLTCAGFNGKCVQPQQNMGSALGDCPDSTSFNMGNLDCPHNTVCCAPRSDGNKCSFWAGNCISQSAAKYCFGPNHGQLDCGAGMTCCAGYIMPTPKPGSCDATQICTYGGYYLNGGNITCPAGQECRSPGYCVPKACPTPPGPQPICLSENTLIDTPNGSLRVQDITVGTLVYTFDNFGNKITAPVLQVSHTEVPVSHNVVHLVLSDGRTVDASKGHPTVDGLTIDHLKVGDTYSNATVTSAQIIPYKYSYTYDLLPRSATGFYIANGIELGSTLKKN